MQEGMLGGLVTGKGIDTPQATHEHRHEDHHTFDVSLLRLFDLALFLFHWNPFLIGAQRKRELQAHAQRVIYPLNQLIAL